MQLKSIREKYRETLQELYSKEEIETFFNWLCESFLDFKSYQVVQHIDLELQEEKCAQFITALKDLKEEKPIQYILGKAYFYGLVFEVNKYTLIPRPETEELVDWVIKDASETQNIKILDIGTGSGCIPVTLAKHLPQAKIFSVDISEEAIKTAQKNAVNNEVEVVFTKEDILETNNIAAIFPQAEQFDIIISNPPYVRNLEKKEIKNNVLKFEPETALFVEDNDPLIFYKKITQLAAHHLKKDGKLYFEINQYLGAETKELILQQGFKEVQLKKDFFEKDRMIKAIK